jgi:ribosomal protein L11 methyltransferase
MYIWRKQVSPEWLRLRSEDLSLRFGAAIAIVEQPGKRPILLQVSCSRASRAHSLVRQFGGRVDKLRRDWLQDFAKRSQTKPLRIGSRLIVQATPDKRRQNRSARTIIIPAETAFGTGEHATTAMCLRLLERHTRKFSPGWSQLDAGTGSGILAIAARSLGADRVLAIDNDPTACAIAKRNARANGMSDIEFRTGDVLKLKLTEKFNVITANLFSELLIAGLPGWSRLLVRDGFLILSGILRMQEEAVVAALRRNGLAIQEARRRGKWVALLAFHSEAEHRLSACAASGHSVR